MTDRESTIGTRKSEVCIYSLLSFPVLSQLWRTRYFGLYGTFFFFLISELLTICFRDSLSAKEAAWFILSAFLVDSTLEQ